MTDNGENYVLSFIDVCTRYSWVCLIKTKGEVTARFREFYALIDTQFGKRIKTLRSDNGREYDSTLLTNFCAEQGIQHQFTVPYSPQQNGIAERYFGTLFSMVRSMLDSSGLPHAYWGEAVLYAAFLKNRLPFRGLKDRMSPFQALYGTIPDLSMVRTFGTQCFVQVNTRKRALTDRSRMGWVMGLDSNRKGYDQSRGIITSRDISFNETRRFKDVYGASSEDEVALFWSGDSDECAEIEGNVPSVCGSEPEKEGGLSFYSISWSRQN
jgi:hypothetical protein